MFVAVLCLSWPSAEQKRLGFSGGGAVSSVVERFVYTEDVGSSTLSPPTMTLAEAPRRRACLTRWLGSRKRGAHDGALGQGALFGLRA